MKFLSNEWFDKAVERATACLKPGKLSLTFCEVCTDCPGEYSTVWMYYDMKNGQLAEAKLGTGEAPQTDYFGSAKYSDHVRICKGELDPKRAVVDKIVSIQDNQGGTNPLKLLKLIDMYMKITDAKRMDGIEY